MDTPESRIFFWSHIFGAGHSKSEGFVCGRAFSVATSAGLNVLLDASSWLGGFGRRS